MLVYKEDWGEATAALDAWWNGEELPRPVVQVTAPRPEPVHDVSPPPEPTCLEEQWLDPDVVIGRAVHWMARTYYGGESYPHLWVNIGPGIAASYMGSDVTFAKDTVWFGREHTMDWEQVLAIRYDPENYWWKATKRLVSEAARRNNGRYIVGTTDLGGVTDILASLRGTLNLLTDLVDHPEEVKAASDIITDLWHRYYEELNDLILTAQEGTSAWMGIWCRGRWYPLQCDFSYMISPAMFEEFVLPWLAEQCRRLDHAIYHWDGPGQIPHLDLLLSIPELDGIQWTPGAGNPGLGDERWFPLYKRILDAGKRLVLLGMSADEIRAFLKEFPCRGVLISTWARTPQEANALLIEIESWSRR